MDEIRGKLAAAEKRELKNQYMAQFTAMGANAETASALADAYMGQKADYFTIMQTFMAERERNVQASLMQNNPKPAGGIQVPNRMTKEQIMKITDTAERQKAIAENIDLFQ